MTFFTIALLASSIVRAQTEPPFTETGLPGPAFSGVVPAPDGRLYGVTYEGGTSNKGTLYSVDTSLSSVVVHVNFDGTNAAGSFEPTFSPDGSQIAFSSYRDGNSEIYVTNANGANQTRLTNNAVGDYGPSWGGLVLAASTNLTATAVSSTQINLAWTDNSGGEDGFLIERCVGNGNCTTFIQIAGTSANVTAFANTGLTLATFYTYRVRVFGTGGNSPYSNSAKDKTPK